MPLNREQRSETRIQSATNAVMLDKAKKSYGPTEPTNVPSGWLHFNTTSLTFKFWDGTAWVDMTDADTLDGLDSTQFLRSDVGDTHSGGTLAVQGLLDIQSVCQIWRNTGGDPDVEWGVSNFQHVVFASGPGPIAFTDVGTIGEGQWVLFILENASGADETITFPAWDWASETPTTIANGKTHVYFMWSTGLASTDVHATWWPDAAETAAFVSGLLALDDLSDVVITTPATKQTLRHNGSNFVNAALSLDDLSNVTITASGVGHVLVDAGAGYINLDSTLLWFPVGGALHTINDVGAAPSANSLLRRNAANTSWEPVSKTELFPEILCADSAGGTSAASSTFVPVPFGAEDFKDTGYTHSTSSSNSEITITNTGRYEISALLRVDETVAGTRDNLQARIERKPSGGGFAALNRCSFPTYMRDTVQRYSSSLPSVPVTLTAGDVIRMTFAVAGGTMTATTIADGSWLRIRRLD